MKVKITISAETADDIMFDTLEEKDGIKVVKRGDWISDGKCDIRVSIFEKDEKFYQIVRSRSGSYFTEYTFDSEYQDNFECTEVEQVEEMQLVWKPVECGK